MTDFEIRYFHADGSLALVHITSVASETDAEDQAKLNQKDFARFEVRETKTTQI
jgi:hypothetical protein